MQTITDAAIEKVAEALLAEEYGPEGHPWSEAPEGERNEYRRLARAAIIAIRELED